MRYGLPAAALAAALFVSGCATEPVKASKAALVPADRVYAYGQEAPGAATVIIVRDSGFTGGGASHTIKVDGVEAATLEAGERATLYLPPGDHVFGVSWGWGRSSNNVVGEILLRLEAGKPRYIRTSGQLPAIQPSAEIVD